MAKIIPTLTPKQNDRFWSYVEIGAPDECWTWTGSKLPRGYGVISFGSWDVNRPIKYLAHRVSMALDGRDPLHLLACHHCDNPSCVNPKHLFVGSGKENMQDAVAKNRVQSGDNHYSRRNPELMPSAERRSAYMKLAAKRGSTNHNAKLTEDQVYAIRSDTRKLLAIAADYGVGIGIISAIRLRQKWTHLPER